MLRGGVNFWTAGREALLRMRRTITPAGKGSARARVRADESQAAGGGALRRERTKCPSPSSRGRCWWSHRSTGAVIRDIVTTVRRKNPVIDIVVRDVRVQGEGAAHEIAGVLARVDRLGYDVVIIARGGGSLEDLAPFYDEELVRAVFAMKTPVVSAVGHETDFSLVDFVADARAATPTAAAELVAYDYYALVDEVKSRADSLKRSTGRMFERKTSTLRFAGDSLGRRMAAFHTAEGTARACARFAARGGHGTQSAGRGRAHQHACGQAGRVEPVEGAVPRLFQCAGGGKERDLGAQPRRRRQGDGAGCGRHFLPHRSPRCTRTENE